MMAETTSTRHWDRAIIDGLGLEYVVQGVGEPVVLIHAGVGAAIFARHPLAAAT